MAKSKEKFPTVFIACPFNRDMARLIKELKKFPWRIEAANAEIKNDHLLKKITNDIEKSDFAIFDISGWNPNVCLELGLAQGMKKDYYIINNNTIKKDAISDIKGIERIDFNWKEKNKAAPLYDQIKDGIFKRQFNSSKIWKFIEHKEKAEKKFILALNMLASFKGQRINLKRIEIKKLGRGLSLREQDFEDLIDDLIDLKFFKKTQKTGDLTLIKQLYK